MELSRSYSIGRRTFVSVLLLTLCTETFLNEHIISTSAAEEIFSHTMLILELLCNMEKSVREKPFLYCCLRKMMLKEIQFTLIVTFLIYQQQAQQQLISINPHIIFFMLLLFVWFARCKKKKRKNTQLIAMNRERERICTCESPVIAFFALKQRTELKTLTLRL